VLAMSEQDAGGNVLLVFLGRSRGGLTSRGINPAGSGQGGIRPVPRPVGDGRRQPGSLRRARVDATRWMAGRREGRIPPSSAPSSGDAQGIARPEAPGERRWPCHEGAVRPAVRQSFAASGVGFSPIALRRTRRATRRSTSAAWRLSGDAPQSTDRQHRPADPGRRRSWRSENRPTPCRPMPSCRRRRRSGHRMSRCRPR